MGSVVSGRMVLARVINLEPKQANASEIGRRQERKTQVKSGDGKKGRRAGRPLAGNQLQGTHVRLIKMGRRAMPTRAGWEEGGIQNWPKEMQTKISAGARIADAEAQTRAHAHTEVVS